MTFDTGEPENTVDLKMKQMLWVKKVKCFYGLENTSGYTDRNWGISQSECAGRARRRSGRTSWSSDSSGSNIPSSSRSGRSVFIIVLGSLPFCKIVVVSTLCSPPFIFPVLFNFLVLAAKILLFLRYLRSDIATTTDTEAVKRLLFPLFS